MKCENFQTGNEEGAPISDAEHSDSHDAKKSISQTFAEQWWQPRVVVPYVNEFKQYGESKTIFSRMSHFT